MAGGGGLRGQPWAGDVGFGTVVARRQQQGIREWAGQLFEAALPPTLQFKNPRAWAFTLLGIHEYLTRYSGDRIAQDAQRVLGERLLDMYQPGSDSDWLWFENVLTYCNAKLPHALLVCGRSMLRDDMVETALESLEWLAQIQRADGEHFVPIGCNGFYPQGGERAGVWPLALLRVQSADGHTTDNTAGAGERC